MRLCSAVVTNFIMNYTTATGSSAHTTVNLIMLAKPLDIIVGQPTTKSMDRMTEQMAQMVAPVKTTAWGGLHGSLALVLDDADYAIVTHGVVTSTIKPRNANFFVYRRRPKNCRWHLISKKQSPTSVSNASSTTSRISMLRNSTGTILVMPTKQSNRSLHIFAPNGAK